MKFDQLVEQAAETASVDQEIKTAQLNNDRALVALLNRKKQLLQTLATIQQNVAQIDNQIAAQRQKKATAQKIAQTPAPAPAVAQPTAQQAVPTAQAPAAAATPKTA